MHRGLAAAPGLGLGRGGSGVSKKPLWMGDGVAVGLPASVGAGSRAGQVWAWKGVVCPGPGQTFQEGQGQGNGTRTADEQLVLPD